MTWVAVAIGGAAVVGAGAAVYSSSQASEAAGEATEAQVEANNQNIALQQQIFEQQREDNAPWREIGAQALTQLKQGIDRGEFKPGKFDFKFEADPGYQFRLKEGINALDASASARGRLNSGAQQKAIARYASGLASQEYGNAFNRGVTRYNIKEGGKTQRFNQLATLANVGQIANRENQVAGSNMAGNVGAATTATGNAIAQGAYNQAQANTNMATGVAQSINQAGQNYLLYNAMNATG